MARVAVDKANKWRSGSERNNSALHTYIHTHTRIAINSDYLDVCELLCICFAAKRKIVFFFLCFCIHSAVVYVCVYLFIYDKYVRKYLSIQVTAQRCTHRKFMLLLRLKHSNMWSSASAKSCCSMEEKQKMAAAELCLLYRKRSFFFKIIF